jgi:Ca2+-binding RTX toxin-like protein
MNGGAGIDVMAGGSGNDVYFVDGYAEVTVIPGDGDGDPGQGSGKGNEGLGNGEEPPPPGHDVNWNDGPDTSPGNPGMKGGKMEKPWKGEIVAMPYPASADAAMTDSQGGTATPENATAPPTGNGEQTIVTYVTDTVIEEAGGGYDVVNSSITYGLTENVEELHLLGADHLDGSGNGLDNLIVGNAGNNRLTGGLGNDTLIGGAGDDTYIFATGDGEDTINNFDLAGHDRILFDAGVALDGVALFRSGDHLEIGYGTTDRITVTDFFANADSQVDEVRLADDRLLTAADIDGLIQQMAAYAVQEGISLSSLDNVRQSDGLMTLVAGSWHAA